MDVSEDLAGHRVSLRHRVGERDGRPLYSDAVGELEFAAGAILVHTRRGPVQIDPAAVTAVRAVPPAPARRPSLTAVAHLEGLCADAWPAQVDEPLGEWRLRAAGGYTGRANAGLAIGAPAVPIPTALDAVRAFAARHRIGARVHVPAGSPWERAVRAQGWVLDVGHAAGAEAGVLVTTLRPAGEPDRAVELLDRPSREWWSLATGGPPTAAQRHVLDPGGAPRTAFALVRDLDGRPVGQARATVVQDHLHLSMLEVVPAARRRGLATALLAGTAAWGREHGARFGVLQVAVHNSAARALYDRLGWVEHHRYRYLVPPA